MKYTALASLLLCLSTPVSANLITNGGFENPGFSTPPFFRYLANGDSTTIANWTVMDDGIGEQPYLMNIAGYPTSIHEGSYALSLNQGSGIVTDFSVIAGLDYKLSFFAKTTSGIVPDPLDVSIAGFASTFTPEAAFTEYNFMFTASSSDSAAILQFMNTSPVGDFRIWTLDNIQVNQVNSVPAPAAVWLLGSGLIGLIRVRKIS